MALLVFSTLAMRLGGAVGVTMWKTRLEDCLRVWECLRTDFEYCFI